MLETYAKETETGFMMGLEYLTGGKMEINGRKLKVIVKDDQSKPDLGRTLLAEAYGDDKVDIAVGTSSSGSAIAMLPVALEYKKVLIVEPAVADAITGDKWNRYIFRTARSSMQEAMAAAIIAPTGSFAFLAQDYAFGRDGVKTFKEALAATGSKGKVVHEEYAPVAATDFTAAAQRSFDALKDKPQPRVLSIVWAGAHPMNKIADMKPERYGITLAPNGNILPVLKTWKSFAGTQGAIYYYYAFPKNKMNDWLVAEHTKRFKAPPDMFTAGGFSGRQRGGRGADQGRFRRQREAGDGDGRHGVRYAERQNELPQGRPPGHAVDVPLPHQEGPEERVGPARTGARNPGQRNAAANP